MKGASVYDLISVKNMVDMLTVGRPLAQNKSLHEALLIIRDAWCIYDLCAYGIKHEIASQSFIRFIFDQWFVAR